MQARGGLPWCRQLRCAAVHPPVALVAGREALGLRTHAHQMATGGGMMRRDTGGNTGEHFKAGVLKGLRITYWWPPRHRWHAPQEHQ